MKHMRKLLAIFTVIAMIMSMGVFNAFAQEVDSEAGGNATITIKNAAKGVEYNVVKVFDATVSDTGSIAYLGTIPEALADYFEYTIADDATSNIKIKDGVIESELVDAVVDWAKEQTADVTTTAEGGELTFTGLGYGYYAVISGQGTAVTVASTNPDAEIYDKNTTVVGVKKEVDDKDVAIGQTVTYTFTGDTANFVGEAPDTEIVTHYVIYDTLPDFLTNVEIISVKVDDAVISTDEDSDGKADRQFGDVDYNADETVDYTNAIMIEWAAKDDDDKYVSKYANGAVITIEYTATVTANAVIDGEGNKNTITMEALSTPEDGTPDPWDENWDDSVSVSTYATALKKVDENGQPLAGAVFAANGLTVDGADGKYTVTAYDPASTTLGTAMQTDANGNLLILGIPSDAVLTVYEVEAPKGYNKLTTAIELPAQKINETVTVTSTTVYYDEEGNVTDEQTETSTTTIEYNAKLEEVAVKVENKMGAELPSTGAMGTVIFVSVGSLIAVATALLLVTKKRMKNAGF